MLLFGKGNGAMRTLCVLERDGLISAEQRRRYSETLTPLLLERARRIRLLALDVDGVLTDGRIYYDDRGAEIKAFSTRDGLGMRLLADNGVILALITARQSEIVARRAALTRRRCKAAIQCPQDCTTSCSYCAARPRAKASPYPHSGPVGCTSSARRRSSSAVSTSSATKQADFPSSCSASPGRAVFQRPSATRAAGTRLNSAARTAESSGAACRKSC